jgi:hypothetical protein
MTTRTRTRRRDEHRTPKTRGTDTTMIVCVMTLLIMLSLAGSYVLYIFRDTTVSKTIITICAMAVIGYVMHAAHLGPFKHHR